MNCKRLFCSLAASAFAFVLNALFFCRKRKKHNPRFSSPVPSPEQEALLGNEPLTSAVLHAAGHLRGSPPTAHSLADSLGLSVDATQLEASAVASCHEDPCSRVDKPIIDTVQPFPKPGVSPVTELDVQPLLLQLSAGSGDMLGEDSSTCSPAAMEHLQDLLDVELGPPKFHVPKPTSPAVPSLATHSILDIADSLAPAVTGPEHQPYGLQQAMQLVSELAPPPVNLPDAAQLEGDSAQKLATVAGGLCKPHLRLEVLSGPATGRILDSLDIQAELRIGRFPDAALSLSEDPEVSGQHAVVRFCQKPGAAHWELVDVGSLNGTSLNGTAIGMDNRKPGLPQPLSEGDIITVGSSTRLSVSCQPSHLPPGPPSGSLPHPLMSMADHQHTPQHQQPASGAGADPTSTAQPAGAAGATTAGMGSQALVGNAQRRGLSVKMTGPVAAGAGAGQGAWGQGAELPLSGHHAGQGPQAALLCHPALGISMAVHQRVGSEHKRVNVGCEDKVHWELPFEGCHTAGLLALFDGHNGAKAATTAVEIVPSLLRQKVAASGAAYLIPVAAAAASVTNPMAAPSTAAAAAAGSTAAAQATATGAGPAAPAAGEVMAQGPGAAAALAAREQAERLTSLFLEADTLIASDEGCTATLVLLQLNPEDGSLMVQTANVGDSAALLVRLPHPPATPPPPALDSWGPSTSTSALQHSSGPGQQLLGTSLASRGESAAPKRAKIDSAWQWAKGGSGRMEGVVEEEAAGEGAGSEPRSPAPLPAQLTQLSLMVGDGSQAQLPLSSGLPAQARTTTSADTSSSSSSNAVGSGAGTRGGDTPLPLRDTLLPMVLAPGAAAAPAPAAAPAAAPGTLSEAHSKPATASAATASARIEGSTPGLGSAATPILEPSALPLQPPQSPAPQPSRPVLPSLGHAMRAVNQQGAGGSMWGETPQGATWVRLTADHRIASSGAERARLAQRGHTVRTRLYGLNISRMLGDRFLKDEDLGFLAEPFVSSVEVVPAGSPPAFLVLASDGLWDVVSEGRVAALLAKAAAKEGDGQLWAQEAADLLLKQAVDGRSKDDISIMVLCLRPGKEK